MSKIALSGNPSGTGTFTIASPNSNTDRTLTLPDSSGTLLAGSGVTLSSSAPANTLVTDASGNVGFRTASPTAPVTVGRVDSSNEGGQIDLCRASDNASAWAIDVFGNTSTPTLRIINGATVAASVDGSNNFAFNSGYGSAAVAYGCRAWVNFNGSNGSIRASGNVLGVTRNTTGQYTVNFSSAMPDANYAVLYGFDGTDGASGWDVPPQTTSMSTTSFTVRYRNIATTGDADPPQCHMAVIR